VEDFSDNRFDSVPLIDIVKKIEEVKKSVRPHAIFTHSGCDLNIDHRITHNAVLTATRPLKTETVMSVYAFEILSSTEWNFPALFQPDVYYDITGTLSKKLMAIKRYVSELKSFPHPRSIKGVETNALYRGMQAGVKYAEAFKLIRDIK
jgi:LmbE family N-acetylglucosaminyl deacetylase